MKEANVAARSANRKSPAETGPSTKFKTVDAYFSSLPPAALKLATEVRSMIKKLAPQAEEVISYNIPAFRLNGKVLLWYAAWKEHISLYPRSAAMEAAIPGLADYEGGKGTVKIPATKKLPRGLVKKIIRFKVAENMATARKAVNK